MNRHPVELQIEKADRAIVAEDFDTLLDIYTDNAILVVEPGRNAEGKDAIRKAFEAMAVYFKTVFTHVTKFFEAPTQSEGLSII
jgi:ketosteroid isomerase-like protein